MNDLTPSELIYLYIDGEADAGQQAALFTALAHDSDLQAEFNDALAMRLSVSAEVRTTVPPPGIKEALLHKAGFVAGSSAATAGAAAPASSAPVVGSTVHTAAPGLVSTGLTAALKGVMTPLFAGVVGAATFVTGLALWYGTTGTEATTSGSTTATTTAVAPVHPEPVNSPPTAAPLPSAGFSSSSDPLLAFHTPRSTPQPTAASRSVVSPVRMSASGASSPVRRIDDVAVAHGADIAPVINGGAVQQSGREIIGQAAILPAGYLGQSAAAEAIAAVQHLPPSEPVIDDQEPGRWLLHARGIAGLRLFPLRSFDDAAGAGSLLNVAVAAQWRLDDEHAIGVEVGREALPMFVRDNTGAFQQQSSILWGGVLYRYSPAFSRLPGGIRPVASGVVGGAVSGPVLKSTLGVVWCPGSDIQLAIGLEGTALLYRYRGQWFATQKLGVSYGVTVRVP